MLKEISQLTGAGVPYKDRLFIGNGACPPYAAELHRGRLGGATPRCRVYGWPRLRRVGSSRRIHRSVHQPDTRPVYATVRGKLRLCPRGLAV